MYSVFHKDSIVYRAIEEKLLCYPKEKSILFPIETVCEDSYDLTTLLVRDVKSEKDVSEGNSVMHSALTS